MAEISMREKVARAIEESMRSASDKAGVDIEVGEITIDAVLAAMREPTEAMVAAGMEAFWPGPEIVYPDEHDGPEAALCAAWQAMIDAASRLPLDRVPILDHVKD